MKHVDKCIAVEKIPEEYSHQKCETCDKVFRTMSRFEIHKKWHHEIEFQNSRKYLISQDKL